MLTQGKTMEIAELYDLTHSYATTAQLAGVDPKTVKRALARRAAGYPPETRERGSVADPYLDKIDEWIERSSGLALAEITRGRAQRTQGRLSPFQEAWQGPRPILLYHRRHEAGIRPAPYHLAGARHYSHAGEHSAY